MNNLPFFSIKGLHKNFGGVIATNNVSIDINKNEIFGIIGPNGAGKTTLFNMITGVYHPSEGHIFLESTQLDGMPVHKIAQAGVARTFQNIRLFSDLTCYENVKTSCQKNVHYGFLDGILRTSRCRSEEARLDNECKEYLREVGLWEQANVLARNLPYGMQRRLEIARAMVTFPKLLLLDDYYHRSPHGCYYGCVRQNYCYQFWHADCNRSAREHSKQSGCNSSLSGGE